MALVGATLLSPLVAHLGYGIGFSPVLSQSMQPTFSAGDLEITHLVQASAVGVGDVVVLNDPEEAHAQYSHRVTNVASTSENITLSTRGDANPTGDRNPVVVETTAQISKVVTTVPLIGYAVLFFASPDAHWFGLALASISAALFLAQLFARKHVKLQPKEILI